VQDRGAQGDTVAVTSAQPEAEPAEAPPASPQPEPAPVKEESATAAPRTIDDLLDSALTGKGQQGVGSGYGRGAEAKMAAPRPSAKRARSDSRRIGKRKAATSGIITLRRAGPVALAPVQSFDTEAYAHVAEQGFSHVVDKPLSTFSIDVDTASYSNVRRFLRDGRRPPADAVRVEELLNYFRYDYPSPASDEPFTVHTEVAAAPWNPRHRLVQVGLRARDIDAQRVPARNLVFLLDVSGSMQSGDKLPLLKRGLALLVDQLRPQDRLAVVVYAGASGLVLPSTRGSERGTILNALESLYAGGSTNGAAGIELAYRVATEHFIEGGINRVVLATDGDFNVGVTSHGELTRLIERKRKSGVFLTVLGFGRGNLKDATMEQLADKGNGNYAYVDSLAEARKVLVREAGSTLVTIAKDVKLQVELNPARVESYRLIGYENRALADRDFNDDTKDAGEMGAGHTVTALYEVVLAKGARAERAKSDVDPLRYQSGRALTGAAASDELMTVKVRYKPPTGSTSTLSSVRVTDAGHALANASQDFRWAAAVASFGMVLRGSHHKGDASLEQVLELAAGAVGRDRHGDRRELVELVRLARSMGIGS
jgi:Ca-activated chloride channel family protein